jgi:prolipoprotein diacylglyceryl transferase
MEFHSPGPIICYFGDLPFRWYGTLMTLGFAAAALITARLGVKEGWSENKLLTGSLIGFLGGVLGGRLYYVACQWDYYSQHPFSILATWEGGMAIHGGIIGGFVAGILAAHLIGLPWLRCMDYGGCGTVLAQAIGRWGNFFNNEAFGKPVGNDFLLKLFIPANHRPDGFAQFSYFHPTFLYESAINFSIFLFLYFYLVKKLKNYPGVCFFVYMAIYSVGRLLIEPMRLDSIRTANHIPVPIIASAVELVVSLAIITGLVVYHNAGRKKLASPTTDRTAETVRSA